MGRLFEPFILPNGSKLKNRVVKAAMEEDLADTNARNGPSKRIVRLYSTWAKGGAGLVLSGNVMIDPTATGTPSNIMLSDDTGAFDEKAWREWIQAAQENNTQFWFQLNHPGRQVMKGSGLPSYGPSAVRVEMGALSSQFEVPLEMSDAHIRKTIARFVWAARKAEALGASGIQVHAAHGYLVSQFLSPLSNKRTDQWGGSLENRARLLLEIVRQTRAAVSPNFGVSVKINSSDFQKGGFDTNDLRWVVTQLNDLKLDFLEISGGTYESPAMAGEPKDGELPKAASTIAREAYFLEAAKEIKEVAQMPLMVTGGVRRRRTAEAIADESDHFLVGIGTALGLVPDLPNRWSKGEDPAPVLGSPFLPKMLSAIGKTVRVQFNMQRISEGKKPWPGVWPIFALILFLWHQSQDMKKYQTWIHGVPQDGKVSDDKASSVVEQKA